MSMQEFSNAVGDINQQLVDITNGFEALGLVNPELMNPNPLVAGPEISGVNRGHGRGR